MDIGILLPQHARCRPDHPAFVCGQERFSYRDLNAYVNKLANALLACGLSKGDKFATVLPNCTQLLAAYWAAAKTGLVIVPGSTMLNEGGPGAMLKSSDTSLVIADIEKEKVTHIVMVPAQNVATLKSPAFDPAKLASLEMIHNVGAPLLIKDMIISGGVNVYPKDIEEVVIQHSDVSEVAVIGVPDEKWGEVPVAHVVLHSHAGATAAELKDWTNQRVDAKFQRVRDVVVMDEFPRNVAGKMLKREMREAYRRGRED